LDPLIVTTVLTGLIAGVTCVSTGITSPTEVVATCVMFWAPCKRSEKESGAD
jgi:hypothetical protein